MKPSKAKRKSKRKKKNSSAPPPQGGASDAGDGTRQKEEEGGGGEDAKDGDERSLNWLADAFSSSSLEEIHSAYREAKGDPFKAAAIQGGFSGDPKQIGGPNDRKKKCPGIRKEKKVVASTGLVSDVIGKDYGRSSTGDCGRSSETKRFGKQPCGHEEAEEFLFSMLGDGCELDAGVVRDVFGHCGYDVEKALDILLDMSASRNQFRENGSGNCRGNALNYSMIPTERFVKDRARKNLELMDKIPDSSNHPSEKEHEHQQSVGYGFRDHTKVLGCSEEISSSRSGMTKLDLQQKVLESLFNIPDTSKHELDRMDWKKVVKKVESFDQGFAFSYASIAEPLQKTLNVMGTSKEDDYQVFRSTARQHWDAMKSYYQKAAVSYSKGERAHAGYLSEKGKHHSKLAHEADEKASREIFEARNKDIQNTVTIDLHGQHVKQAIRLLKLHLLLFTYIPSIQFLRVITGCGTHGVGKGKLKHSVIGLIEKEGIEWSEDNPGTLVIRLDGLKQYSFISTDSDSE